MKDKEYGNRVILGAFVIIICLSNFIWIIMEKYVDFDGYEGRMNLNRPVINVDNYTKYADDFETYYNNKLPFRNILISINSMIDFWVFDKSASAEVIKGIDGWLFYADTLDDYCRNNLYSQSELEAIKNDLLNTKQYFDKREIEFIVFIGPNKASVYGDYMPKKIKTVEENSRTEQLVNYLRENTDITIIYPKKDLLSAREKYPDLMLYLKLDTHWNYMGGYFAAIPLLNALGVKMKKFDEVSYEQINEPDFFWNGYDLSNMSGLSDILNEDINYHLYGYSEADVTYDGDVRSDVEAFYGSIRTYSNASDDRKIFLARDSFGEAISPYLAAGFKEMYSVSYDSMTKTQIEEENPDVFIYEMVERYGDYYRMNVDCWNE
ncbi:MAG: hypothetical protein NC400_10175 [Clostridium sp.]|nr:hypothetical protein [Clostridium sp.]